MVDSSVNSGCMPGHSNPINHEQRSFVIRTGSALHELAIKICQFIAKIIKYIAEKLGFGRDSAYSPSVIHGAPEGGYNSEISESEVEGEPEEPVSVDSLSELEVDDEPKDDEKAVIKEPPVVSFADVYKTVEIANISEIDALIKEIRKDCFNEDIRKQKVILPFFGDFGPREVLFQQNPPLFKWQEVNQMLKTIEEINNEFAEAQEREQKAVEVAKEELNESLNESLFESYIEIEPNLAASLFDDQKVLKLTEAQSDIRAYMYRLALTEEKISDDTPICFKKGLIKVLKHLTDEKKKRSLKTFFYLLKASYGPVLTEIVKARYSLDQIDTLTFADLKRALVGVATNVREEDLKDLFRFIKNYKDGDKCLPAMTAGNYILDDENLLKSLQSKENFTDLTSKEIDVLVKAFRTLTGRDGITKDIFEILYPGKKVEEIEGKETSYVFKHDIDFLDFMHGWEYLYLYHHELAITEYMGKSLPYKELKVGMVLPLPNSKNEVAYYKVQDALPSKKDAVRAYLITPLNTHQDAYDTPSVENINLVFRGTEPSRKGIDSGASIARDLESTGVGKQSFLDREKEILEMVERYLRTTKSDNVTLNISGHSLGGCDTQRSLASVLEKIADAGSGSLYKKIKKIIITSHNAPGVDLETNDRYFRTLEEIEKKNLNFSLEINHVRYKDETYDDVIQKAGDVLIGAKLSHVANFSFVKRRVVDITFEMNPGLVYGLLPRHSIRALNKKKCQLPWQLDVYDEGNKQLEEKLAKNWYWDEKDLSWYQTINWYAGYASKPLQFVGQTAISYLFSFGLNVARIGQAQNLRRLT